MSCRDRRISRSTRRTRAGRSLVVLLFALPVFAACGDDGGADDGLTGGASTTSVAVVTTPSTSSSVAPTSTIGAVTPTGRAPLPGMPALVDPANVYSGARTGIAAAAQTARPLVYVPNSKSGTVSVIDPETFQVIDTFPTGRIPQHVVPSWDLKTLWVNNNSGNTLTPIDPTTGTPGASIPVEDPYNLYFRPDGAYAIVMEERNATITFRDAHSPTLEIVKQLPVPCDGVNHADFSPDGTFFVASCEFSGELIKVDAQSLEVTGELQLDFDGSMPQDVRLAPDGKTWLVADMMAGGLWLVDGEAFTVRGFLPTGGGAHGIYPSRDATQLYVSNRTDGSVSVVDAATLTVARTWDIPGGGSPDMGGVSADGKVLWLSGRNHGEVYAIDVQNWTLLARIKVGASPHGLAVFPQPGRYSLGHTGNYR